MQQLTIFEVEPINKDGQPFDFEKARVIEKQWMGNDVERFCYVSALIPDHILSPLEMWESGNRKKTKETEQITEQWGEYVFAIWHYQRYALKKSSDQCDWEKATRMLTEARENSAPIKMRVSLDGIFRFSPELVVEYL